MTENNTGDIMLNELKNEFIFIKDSIEIPQIHVKGISNDQRNDLKVKLEKVIPDYLKYHELLLEPRPKNEIYTVQFVKPLKGEYFDFVHFFNVDLKFGGDSSEIIEMGNPDYFPSYNTDRIYYKSFILPVERKDFSSSIMDSFEVDKIMNKMDIEVDQSFHTYAMFDEIDTTQIIEKIYALIGNENIKISHKKYSFFKFISLSIAFNILDPLEENIDSSLEVFEPMWLFLKSKLSSPFLELSLNNSKIIELFSKYIVFNDNELSIHENFKNNLKDYFSKFSFCSDDNLALKRWMKVEIQS